jgi:serine/threonine protein phosphatase PrpC
MHEYQIIGDTQAGNRHPENQDRIVRRLLHNSGETIGCLVAVIDGVSTSAFGTSIARWIGGRLDRDALTPDAGDITTETLRNYWRTLHDEFQSEYDDLSEMLESAACVSAAWAIGERLDVLWAGDSPIYLTRETQHGYQTTRVSVPHRGTQLHHITKSFCGAAPFEPDVREFSFAIGDIVTILSDGAFHEEMQLSELYESGEFHDDVCTKVTRESVALAHSDDTSMVACKRIS